MHRHHFCILIFSICSQMLLGQTGSIYGIISLQGQPVEYAQVATAPTHFGAVSNAAGEFKIHDLPYGTYWVTASYVGYEDVVTEVTISASVPDYQLMPDLKEQTLQLDTNQWATDI